MLRRIIEIDENKCSGCGICANACHEGAIAMVEGKAKLLRDDYCDGLGDCLPTCPTGAIAFVEREAASYDEVAVQKNQIKKHSQSIACECPGTQSKKIERGSEEIFKKGHQQIQSQLTHWPVQIKLAPIHAPYFEKANLLIAADCTAYAYGDFHNEFIHNRVVLIGCSKLDDGDYTDKLTEIIANNDIKSVTVVRMEVPCCGGIEHATKTALQNSGKFIPWQVVTISTDGKILDR